MRSRYTDCTVTLGPLVTPQSRHAKQSNILNKKTYVTTVNHHAGAIPKPSVLDGKLYADVELILPSSMSAFLIFGPRHAAKPRLSQAEQLSALVQPRGIRVWKMCLIRGSIDSNLSLWLLLQILVPAGRLPSSRAANRKTCFGHLWLQDCSNVFCKPPSCSVPLLPGALP